MARTVTMDEIAARSGVSRGAVSLALRGSAKISAKTTEHILSVARDLGYRPNLNASRLARGDYTSFGLLVSDLHNPIMADILDGFALQEDGAETYLASGFNAAARERAAVEGFLAQRVKGIVLMGSLLPEAEIMALAKLLPVVAVGRRISGIDCVLVDDEAGGRLAADHLLSFGNRQLAHIDGGAGAGALRRKEAFLATAEAAGASVAVQPGNYTEEGGHAAAMSLFAKTRPQAIFAANDLTALGVLGAAREHGLTVGRDFALMGFDDIRLAGYDYVSLTSIRYSRTDMGASARTLLARRCADSEAPPEIVELPPELVQRSTTRKQVEA